MDLPVQLHLLQDLSGKTQTELARELGVSFVAFNRWINGKAVPRPRAFIRRPTSRDSSTAAVTSTASSACSFCSNGQCRAAPVSVSAPALLTQRSRPPQRSQASAARRVRAAQPGEPGRAGQV